MDRGIVVIGLYDGCRKQRLVGNLNRLLPLAALLEEWQDVLGSSVGAQPCLHPQSRRERQLASLFAVLPAHQCRQSAEIKVVFTDVN